MYTWFSKIDNEGNRSEDDGRYYEESYKDQVISYYKEKGITETNRKFGINKSTIYGWVNKAKEKKKKDPKKKVENHTYSKVEIPEKSPTPTPTQIKK
jgi:transposase-like protein